MDKAAASGGKPEERMKLLSEAERVLIDDVGQIPLLYYSYHIMVGLGTIFVAVMLTALLLLWRKRLYRSRWMLWILMLSFPFPYIANTAGWMTAEVGRQPWLVYGLMRTQEGYSAHVSSGNALFTLLGFMGMYTVMRPMWPLRPITNTRFTKLRAINSPAVL